MPPTGINKTISILTLAVAAMSVVVAAAAAPSMGQNQQLRKLPLLMDACSEKASNFLLKTIAPDGSSKMEYPEGDWRRGGPTATTVWALLSSGVTPDSSSALSQAITWLENTKLAGTFPVAMRVRAFSVARKHVDPDILEMDLKWLLNAVSQDDGYKDYPFSEIPSDNFNTHCAVMAVHAAQSIGQYVPDEYWARMEKYWIARQMPDGGWGFRANVAGLEGQSSGQMTAAGLSCLYACLANTKSPAAEATILKGWQWINKNFSASVNPGRGPEWIAHWWNNFTESQQFDGNPAGQQKIIDCVTGILNSQLSDGGFDGANRVTETALALVSLSRCRSPILIARIVWRQDDNSRRCDDANAVRFISARFERMTCWQKTDFASAADWQNAPILHIRGKGRFDPSPDVLRNIKEYILRGGMLLTESMDADATFTLDVQATMKKLFPQYQPKPLPTNDSLLTSPARLQNPPGMMCVSNGVRILMIHIPVDMSAALNAGPKDANLPAFNLMSNLSVLVTDKWQGWVRWSNLWPEEPTGKKTALVARMRYDGNWDPEPMAWSRFSNLLAVRKSLAVEQFAVDIAKLDASKCPVAHLTGTSELKISADDESAIRKFVADGGTIIVDPAGTSEEFAKFIAKKIPTIFNLQLQKLSPDNPLLAGPYNVEKPRLRLASRPLPDQSTQPPPKPPQIEAIFTNGRPAVIIFPMDVTAGLVGYQRLGLKGYSPQSAYELLGNIMLNLQKK